MVNLSVRQLWRQIKRTLEITLCAAIHSLTHNFKRVGLCSTQPDLHEIWSYSQKNRTFLGDGHGIRESKKKQGHRIPMKNAIDRILDADWQGKVQYSTELKMKCPHKWG